MKAAFILAPLAILLILGGYFVSTSNHIVTLDEIISQEQAQVANVYQRRADLIPNLVNSVKGYAKHEAGVFEAVAQARAQIGQVKIGNAAEFAEYEKSQNEFKSAISRLLVVAEQYPQLKADASFRDLMAQLEGTENRITLERQRLGQAIQEYNTYIRRFPPSFIAGLKGLSPKPYFQASPGSEKAPEVKF